MNDEVLAKIGATTVAIVTVFTIVAVIIFVVWTTTAIVALRDRVTGWSKVTDDHTTDIMGIKTRLRQLEE